MAVSSSREAARLLLEAESCRSISADPHFFGDVEIGEDADGSRVDQGTAPISGVRRVYRRPWIIIGVLLMTLALALLAVAAMPQLAATPVATPIAARTTPNSEVVDSARQWLTLVDQGRWDESYRATGASFRGLNTAEVWLSVSGKGPHPTWRGDFAHIRQPGEPARPASWL